MKRYLILFTFLLSVLVGCSTPKLTIDEMVKDSPYIKKFSVNPLDSNRVLLYMGDEFFSKPVDQQFDIVNRMRESYSGNKDFAIFRGDNEPVIYRFSDDTFQVFSTGDNFKVSKAKQQLTSYDKNKVFDFKTAQTITTKPLLLSDKDKLDVWTYAQRYVKEKLKSPTSASFPTFNPSFITSLKDIITVNSYVDADNGFGAKLRKNFTITMDQQYQMQSINIEP